MNEQNKNYQKQLLAELKTALSLIRLNYGNLDKTIWDWQEKVQLLIEEIENNERKNN